MPIPVAELTAAFTKVFVALAVVLIATYLFAPGLRTWLSDEGSLLDWMTVAALASAGGFGLWAVRRSSTESLFPFIIPTIALWGLLDEVRYLVGLLGFEGIAVSGVPVRSYDDLTVAVASWADRVGLAWPHGVIALAAVVVASAVVVVDRSYRWAHRRALVTEHHVIVFLVISLAATLSTPILGLFGDGSTAMFAAEMLELAGAALLVLAALAAADHRRTLAGWRSRLRPWM